MPWMGLETAEGQDVKNLQGLLLANGHGPDGLVGADGKPDGIVGPKTKQALERLQEDRRGAQWTRHRARLVEPTARVRQCDLQQCTRPVTLKIPSPV